MIKLPTTWQHWGKALLASVISGFANAVLSALGLGGAAMVGIKVPQLEWHQTVMLGLSGAFIGMCMYLAKNPVAPDSNTTFVQNPNPIIKP